MQIWIWYQWPAGGDSEWRIQCSNNLWSTVDCRCSQHPGLGGVKRTRTHVLLVQYSTRQRHLCKAGPAKMIPREGPPIYKPYRFVQPQRVGFLRRFGLKTGRYRLCPFWSGIGYMVFEGTTEVYERICRFNSKRLWVRKREKYAHSKWILRIFFCCCSFLSNDDVMP